MTSGDKEKAVGIGSGEDGVDTNAKVDVCLGWLVLGLKGSLICLPSRSN